MHILFVTTALAPITGSGELATFAQALPTALRQLGHDVRIVLPRYHTTNERRIMACGPVATSFLPVGERQEQLCIYTGQHGDLPLYLLDIPVAFGNTATVSAADDDRRFILFARGVLALMLHLREVESWPTDVIHSNDWQTALLPNYLKTFYRYTFGAVGSLYSIHQRAEQGCFSPFTLYLSGLNQGGMVEAKAGLPANTFNFAARSLLFADVISTTSPSAALDMLTLAGGAGLHNLLHTRHERLAGVINGIDTVEFDPNSDPAIAAHYSADEPAGKRICKMAIQQQYQLEVDANRPLLCAIAPLTKQHGGDLLAQSLTWLIGQSTAQVLIVGNGEPAIERSFATLAERYPGRIAYQSQRSTAVERRIYAGSDACLLPAQNTEDGSAAMIGLRYGCVPVVCTVGALNDIVREGYNGNGFRAATGGSYQFIEALQRCLTCFDDTPGWAILRARGMREDYSWLASAREYIGLYDWTQRIVGAR